MSAYFIANYSISDTKLYRKYVAKAMPIIAKYGGATIVADPKAKVLEGIAGGMNIVIQFPTQQAALDWYNDPEYQAIISMRQLATVGGFALVADGFVSPTVATET